jgi:hypothetical protein
VLFEMLTGRAPFEDKDPLAMLGAHVSRKPPTVTDCAPHLDLPPGLEEMVRRGLVKLAAERIGSTIDYLVWIDTVLAAAFPTDMGGAPTGPRVAVRTPAGGDWNLTGALEAVTAPGTVRKAAGSGAAPVVPSRGRAAPAGAESSAKGPAWAAAPADAESSPSAPTSVLPAQTRAVSLGELGEPIPRKWIVRGAIAFGMFVVAAIVLAIATRGSKASATNGAALVEDAGVATQPAPPPPKAPQVKPQAARPSPAPAPRPPVPPAPPPVKSRLDVLVAELDKGATCVARRATVTKLAALGDPAAIPALRAARARIKGPAGNGCLIHEADLAIERLSKARR